MTGCGLVFLVFVVFCGVLLFAKDLAVRAVLRKAVIAILLPGLLLVGAQSVSLGIDEYASGAMSTASMVVQVAWGLLLLAAGGVPLCVMLARTIARKRFERRKARHPDAPWLWLERWSGRPLRYSRAGTVCVSWLVTVVLGGGLLAVSYLNRAEILAELDQSPAQVMTFYLLFSPFVLLAFSMSVGLLRDHLRFGRSTLERYAPCAIVGGEFLGSIQTAMTEVPAGGFSVTLRCVRRELASASHLERKSELWRAEKQVPADQAVMDAGGVTVPVGFFIPPDACPTDAWSPGERIEWTLSAKARVGRSTYYSEFQVPICAGGSLPASTTRAGS